jgi:hypothetical protein
VTAPLPPIYRDYRLLLGHTEEVVLRFSRRHKCTVSIGLRQQAMALMRGVHMMDFVSYEFAVEGFELLPADN